MNEIIEELLKTYCNDEFRRVFIDVQSIAENFELEGLEDALTSIAMDSESYELSDIPVVIHNKTYEYMNYLLRNHEIVASEDATLQQLTLVLNAVWRMQDWIDHESILRITEADGSAEEKFADLVALVEVAESVSVLNTISSVSDSFIEVLQKLYNDEDEEQIMSQINDDYVAQLRMLKQFYETVKNFDTRAIFAFQLIAHGMQLGGSFSFYYNLIKKKLESDDKDILSSQYLALLYLGTDSYLNIVTYWREHNDQFIDDPTLLTKTDISLNNLNNEFISWKSNMERTFGKS